MFGHLIEEVRLFLFECKGKTITVTEGGGSRKTKNWRQVIGIHMQDPGGKGTTTTARARRREKGVDPLKRREQFGGLKIGQREKLKQLSVLRRTTPSAAVRDKASKMTIRLSAAKRRARGRRQ